MSVKISELNEATELKNNDLIPMVDTESNGTKKITKKNFIKNKILQVTTTEEITENTNYTIPIYIVGNHTLLVFFEGCKLSKDKEYIEIGTEGEESTTIQFKDWTVPAGSNLEFLYK